MIKRIKSKDKSVEKINTIATNELRQSPLGVNSNNNNRGVNFYSVSQIINQTGRDEHGNLNSVPVELVLPKISVGQRVEIFKLSSPVFGVVTARMNRISAIDFNVVAKKNIEDKIATELKTAKEIFNENLDPDIRSATIRARMFGFIKNELADIKPDLRNFDTSLLRWKRRIQSNNATIGQDAKDWLMEPSAGTTWENFIKKVVFDKMIHGACAVYKDQLNGRVENFDTLPGGTVHRIKNPYFGGLDGYVQIVNGVEPKIYWPNELAYSQYIPTSFQSSPMIPLESLINKVAESLLFDNLMAEQADGTKPPEKMIIVTSPSNPWADQEKDEGIPLPEAEQSRIEDKINEPRKNAIMTFSGNHAEVVDLSRENTMAVQRERQKDIREDVAMVFNMSNMEVNLTGSGDVSGRSTADAQADIEQGKGILPILQEIENLITREILPFRIGPGYRMEFDTGKNEMTELAVDQKRLENGEITVNELREEKGRPTFDGDEYNRPRGGGPSQAGGDQANPLFMSQV